ncbi:uncharacterized protein DS421_2g57810 [Arachis hypogaea]|nr:uncharacterized protein DS421_2g57810 [Arachis hypogaea]
MMITVHIPLFNIDHSHQKDGYEIKFLLRAEKRQKHSEREGDRQDNGATCVDGNNDALEDGNSTMSKRMRHSIKW